MSRAEFGKPVKRAALQRAAGRCEASGTLFGFDPGERCGNGLAYGVRFEHVNPDANSKDNSLSNALAICPKCWRYKTDHYDLPLTAKTDRQFDKAHGITGRKYRWAKRPMSRRMEKIA